MRYFFDTELDLICKQVGFVTKQKYEWLSDKNPDFNNWSAVWIVKN